MPAVLYHSSFRARKRTGYLFIIILFSTSQPAAAILLFAVFKTYEHDRENIVNLDCYSLKFYISFSIS